LVLHVSWEFKVISRTLVEGGSIKKIYQSKKLKLRFCQHFVDVFVACSDLIHVRSCVDWLKLNFRLPTQMEKIKKKKMFTNTFSYISIFVSKFSSNYSKCFEAGMGWLIVLTFSKLKKSGICTNFIAHMY